MNGEAKLAKIRERLAKIMAAGDGILTPDAVLTDATSPKSPLHRLFLWDDKKAGHRFRLEQARVLIARVTVEWSTKTVTYSTPAYVHDPNVATGEQGYVSVVVLRSDRDRALDVLRNEAARTAALLQRTRDLASAFDLDNELDPILESFAAFQKRTLA